MVKKWAREMFIFQAVIPAEKFIGFSMLESQSWKNKMVTKMGRLKRWWYLSKLLTITITISNFFNCPGNCKGIWNWNFDQKLNHDFTNHGYLHSAAWKALYSFKIKRSQEARHNQFFFQNILINEIFEIFKMFKNSWINVYYTKSKRCSPWTAYSVFDWKYFFWVNLIQKLKIVSLSWNFVPRLIQIFRIPRW